MSALSALYIHETVVGDGVGTNWKNEFHVPEARTDFWIRLQSPSQHCDILGASHTVQAIFEQRQQW